MILCVDPGTRAAGVALFEEDGTLHSAWLAQGSLWHETADSIVTELLDRGIMSVCIRTVVVERMEVYQEMPIPPAVLVTLSLMAGRVSGLFAASAGKPVEYLPKTWKKQVPKEIKLKRIQKELSPEETSRVRLAGAKKVDHNVWDAIGIGLYHLRSKRR